MIYFDVASGKYDKCQIVKISNDNLQNFIYYKFDNSDEFTQYFSPLVISKSTTLQAYEVVNGDKSEIYSINYEIENNNQIGKGPVVVIGGAEHCKELHEKLVELAGGKEKVKILFVPSSSGDPYSGAIDRVTRFRELAGVEIDDKLVPLVDGHHDFSSLENKSRFWILPLALKDDECTCKVHVADDADTPLCDESQLPFIEESKWVDNGSNKEIAEKIRDGGYNLIFFTGGNQLRYLRCLENPDYSDDTVMQMIKVLNQEHSAVVAGTSAGGAAMSKYMITGGDSFGASTQGIIYENVNLLNFNDEFDPHKGECDCRLWVEKGLNFLKERIISDTHFIERGRIGRLLGACARVSHYLNQNYVGIGVDEDTAVVVYDNDTCEVVGASGVFIVDVSKMIFIQETNLVNNVIVHYLEQGDKFSINREDGSVKIIEINKKKLNGKNNQQGEIYYEPDIFGRNNFRKLCEKLLTSQRNSVVAFQLNDNLFNSYDSMSGNDITKSGTVIFRIKRTPETEIFEGSVKYKWWGSGDKYYPELIDVVEENHFSMTNISVDASLLKVANIPDHSDSYSVMPLELYIKEGGREKSWYDDFDDAKNFRFGAALMPLTNNEFEIYGIFYDYAYYDYDRNGYYSPPSKKPEDDDGRDYKDYDVIDINPAEKSEIIVDGKPYGICDDAGYLRITLPESADVIKVLYKGKKHVYEVEFNDVSSFKKAQLKFDLEHVPY